MEIATEYKIIIVLLLFIIIWMSLSFKNVLCEGRAGFGLCYKKAAPACPACPACQACQTGQTGQMGQMGQTAVGTEKIGSKSPAPFLA
jgi:hypothetical protein